MASTTKKVSLTTAFVDISEGNVDVWVWVNGVGTADLFFGPNSAPAASVATAPLNAMQPEGFSISGIAAADRLYAKTSSPGPVQIVVMQKAT